MGDELGFLATVVILNRDLPSIPIAIGMSVRAVVPSCIADSTLLSTSLLLLSHP